MARWDAEAARLGLTWAAWVRALQNESVSMPEVIIYGIRAVGTERIRFVGATARRLSERRKEGYPGRLGEWLAAVEWEYSELERTTVARATEAEARWVAQLGGDGLLFNAGVRPETPGAICLPVELSRETHASAVELAAAGHWSLSAFVQLATEQLVERMKRGERVAVGAGGTETQPVQPPGPERFCALCGILQRLSSGGWSCANGHGGVTSIGARDAELVRGTYAKNADKAEEEYDRQEAAAARPRLPASRVPQRPSGPRGSASNPNSAFAHRDEDDLDEEASHA